MEEECINEQVYNYFENDQTKTALMIDGKWGSGKSYYINNSLKTYLEKKNVKMVVVSLYGKSNLNEILRSLTINHLLEATNKIKFKNKKGIIKSFLGLINFAFSWKGIDANFNYDAILDILKEHNYKNTLVIFEDLERSELAPRELFGMINDFVEHYNYKTLLVTNEKEITNKEEINNYLISKEKTVNETIRFNPDLKTSLINIMNSYKCTVIDDLFETMDSIVEIVKQKLDCNLRKFKYAVQKANDISKLLYSDDTKLDDLDRRLNKTIFIGILLFVEKLYEKSEFPEWDGNAYYSILIQDQHTSYPFFKFVYEYIRNFKQVTRNEFQTYKEEYKKYLENNDNIWENNEYLNILNAWYDQSEKDLRDALDILNSQISNGKFKVSIAGKFIYLVIISGDVIGYKSNALIERLIHKMIIEDDYTEDMFMNTCYFLRGELNNNDQKQRYDTYIEEIKTKIREHGYVQTRGLIEDKDINSLYADIKLNINRYVNNQSFLKNNYIDHFMEMLRKASAKEINQFRLLLSFIYNGNETYVSINKDRIELAKFKLQLENELDQFLNWDKIQKNNISYLCGDIDRLLDRED